MRDQDRIARTRQAAKVAYENVWRVTTLYSDLISAGASATGEDWQRAYARSADARSRLLRAMQVADMLNQAIREKLLERGLVCQDESHDVVPDFDQDDDGN